MRFDPKSGEIELTKEIRLRRGMTRKEVLSLKAQWEEWMVVDGIASGFRTVLNLPNKGISPKTILIVYVGLDPDPITFWDLGPWDLVDGQQSRPEGKYTKRMRTWFFEAFNVKLPAGGDWGHIDASHDPWNSSTAVVCNYRERFDSDGDWQEYRRNNKF